MIFNGIDVHLKPRLCCLLKWPDFNGYGFNLHAEKGKAGQYIGKVDEGSPAQAVCMLDGDRIVEVNGVNIGNENHQQVVGRIKAGGEETTLLVVDTETDQYYKDEKKVVKGDLPEVIVFRCPSHDTESEPEAVQAEEVPPSYNDVTESVPIRSQFRARLCHMKKRPDFNGYGFNLHAERDKPGQFIGTIDDNSPAMHADLREGDRIIEVNSTNIESDAHQKVIELVKTGGDETTLLVVDKATDEYYKNQGIAVTSSMGDVDYKSSVREAEQITPVEDTAEAQVAELAQTEPEFAPEAPPQGEEVSEVTKETVDNAAVNGQALEPVTTYTAPEPEPERAPEPTPVIPTEPTPEPPKEANGSTDIFGGMSAKEMKERLKSRKKADPRTMQVGFGEKHKMFERL